MRKAKIGTHVKRSFIDIIKVLRKFMPDKLEFMGET